MGLSGKLASTKPNPDACMPWGGATANEWNGRAGTVLVGIFFRTLRPMHEQPASPTPPIASYANFYITLTTELADDISLRHTVLTFYSSSRSLTLILTCISTMVLMVLCSTMSDSWETLHALGWLGTPHTR